MISWVIILACIFLLIASFLDIKYQKIPSVLLTMVLLFVFIMNPENLVFGIGACLFALMINDLLTIKNLELGVADFKAIAILGLLVTTMQNFFLFLGIFAVIQFGYTISWIWFYGSDKNRPFLPCIFIVFLVMLALGGFA